MKSLFFCLLLALPSAVWADEQRVLTNMLDTFLDGASRNDPMIHNAFWAEELIYTSSAGTRFGKAQLMQGVNSRGEIPAAEVSMRYGREDLQIMQYGDTAVVAFVLVGKSATETLRFLNSGTLVKRNGQWQVVNWQATKLSEPSIN
ncbi:nuclear transport factor 2 family protein [Alishewanella sp. 16-MA]|uniref:Nuclear transport factor 2 family protein n=1 Tax=Alishewanella maricola TaxID=2795740 RepID=A0ABS8C0Z5_9ALTE|nr:MULTISPECIES: nuclear transport factor 2 family protein [Gammaproteobacteria]MCB5225996.1 nuclear transport factor 2 family protein [Alishewanella maricola]MCC5450193.1 nuclear transport factor 2 family protein [Rheinheimera sp. UJ51]MDP5037183.1 nuclear transport factor 2 family protein [Alishewanella sp.]